MRESVCRGANRRCEGTSARCPPARPASSDHELHLEQALDKRLGVSSRVRLLAIALEGLVLPPLQLGDPLVETIDLAAERLHLPFELGATIGPDGGIAASLGAFEPAGELRSPPAEDEDAILHESLRLLDGRLEPALLRSIHLALQLEQHLVPCVVQYLRRDAHGRRRGLVAELGPQERVRLVQRQPLHVVPSDSHGDEALDGLEALVPDLDESQAAQLSRPLPQFGWSTCGKSDLDSKRAAATASSFVDGREDEGMAEVKRGVVRDRPHCRAEAAPERPGEPLRRCDVQEQAAVDGRLIERVTLRREVTDHHVEEIAIELREGARQLVLPQAEDLLHCFIEGLLDDARRPGAGLHEPAPLLVDAVAQCAQLLVYLLDGARMIPYAPQRGFHFLAKDACERFRGMLVRAVKHLVRCAEDHAEEVQLLAENLEGELLRLVVLGEEVDHRDFVPLAVAMAPPDPLLDALRVPGQVVVHDRLAELQVQSLRSRFRRDQDSRPGSELVNQRKTHGHRRARLRAFVLRRLRAPAPQRLRRARGLIRAPKKRDLLVRDELALDEAVSEVILRLHRLREDDELARTLALPDAFGHEAQGTAERTELAVLVRKPVRALHERPDPRELRTNVFWVVSDGRLRRRPGRLDGPFQNVLLEVAQEYPRIRGVVLRGAALRQHALQPIRNPAKAPSKGAR